MAGKILRNRDRAGGLNLEAFMTTTVLRSPLPDTATGGQFLSDLLDVDRSTRERPHVPAPNDGSVLGNKSSPHGFLLGPVA